METLGLLTNQQSSSYCDFEPDISFVGEHDISLCGSMGEPFPFALELGEGTQYPKASDLAGVSLPISLSIVNDFRVDVNFSFTGKNVAIAEGATIDLDQNISFTLDDSNLFACEGMWDGILLDHGCVFTSMNNTIIEDALVAVSVDNKDDVTLDITRTIFNRDLIGIGINNSDTSPNFSRFRRNEFTCSSPLNGAVKQITFAGISCVGGPLDISNSFVNKYNKIQYGVIGQGEKTTHNYGARFDFFENIRVSGIHFVNGSVDMKTSSFTNCGESGIRIETADQVFINNSTFSFDGSALLLNTNSQFTVYTGIDINDFASNANVSVQGNSSFNSSNFGDSQRMYFIHLLSAKQRPAKISIFSNVFNINSARSIGVLLNGTYNSTGEIDIENNDFNFDDVPNTTERNVGIFAANGDKYNMSIIENNFNATLNTLTRGCGINLDGDLFGTNNFVEGNTFFSQAAGFNWLPAIQNVLFDNTKICNNTNNGGNQFFTSFGQFLGLEFTSNTSNLGQLIDIVGANSFIGANFNTGNKFNPIQIGNIFIWAFPQAQHAATNPMVLNMSKFTVHQPQTTSYLNFPNGYSSFHPELITPDDDNEWWVFDPLLDEPTSICQSQKPPPITNPVYNSIANGAYAQVATPTENWNAEMGLYNILIKDSEAVESSNGLQSFMSRKSDSNIEAFYNINSLLDESGREADNISLLNQAKRLNDNINSDLVIEENLKQFYAMLIDRMLRDGEFSDSEISSLIDIASQCPKEGGMAVFLSRAFLPSCIGEFNDFTEDCLGEINPESIVEREIAFKIVEANGESVSHKKSEVFLSPNPISGNQISLSATQAGVLQIFTLEGKLIEEFSFDGSQVLNVENLPTGISFYHVLYSDGDSETGKLIKL